MCERTTGLDAVEDVAGFGRQLLDGDHLADGLGFGLHPDGCAQRQGGGEADSDGTPAQRLRQPTGEQQRVIP
jgi:hypothetical protein